MHSCVQLQHKILYTFHPIQSLKTQTTAPYVHIRSEESTSLVPKVSEMFMFNSSACGFVRRLGWPGHPNLNINIFPLSQTDTAESCHSSQHAALTLRQDGEKTHTGIKQVKVLPFPPPPESASTITSVCQSYWLNRNFFIDRIFLSVWIPFFFDQ